ncbi:MAG: hypothetical protein K2J18_05065 [Paramuribaculum sp.]|nr:hypothetical protein [Paramuribaculum sp.]MDE7471830.1 hypothetical protein [Paramuribaculum sp.]
MRDVNNRNNRTPKAKPGRTVVLYFLLLMLALAGMVSMKRCQTKHNTPAPSIQTEQEVFIETIGDD